MLTRETQTTTLQIEQNESETKKVEMCSSLVAFVGSLQLELVVGYEPSSTTSPWLLATGMGRSGG